MRRGVSTGLRIALVVLAAASLLLGIANALSKGGSQDFQWGPSRVLLAGNNPYTPYIEYRKGHTPTNPYILKQVPFYPASGYVFLWPYAALDWKAAKLCWALSNVIFTFFILLGMRRIIPSANQDTLLLSAALLLISTPHRNTIGNGQHGLFCLAAFIWAVVFSQRGRTWVGGVLLALSWFKYTITFPLSLFLLARRRFAPVLVAGVVHLLLTAFVSVWIHEPPTAFMFKTFEVPMLASETGEGSARHPSYVDSFGLTTRLGTPLGVPIALFAAVVTTVAIVLFKSRARDELLLLSFLALVSLALSFHRTYDWVALVFPLSLVLSRGLSDWSTVLFGLLITATWYAQRVLDLLVRLMDRPVASALDASLYVVTLGLFYAALATSVSALLRTGSNAAASPGRGREGVA